MNYVVTAYHLFTIAASTNVSAGLMCQENSVAMFCLLLPGKVLHISALLAAKRFRDKGNKDGAVRAIKRLESAGLGTVIDFKPPRGTSIVRFLMCNCWSIQLLVYTNFGVLNLRHFPFSSIPGTLQYLPARNFQGA